MNGVFQLKRYSASSCASTSRWTAPTAVVLKAAVGPVWLARVEGHVVKLADRRGVEIIPGGGAVIGDVEAAIAAHDHVPAVARVDPQSVLVRVDAVAAVWLKRL